MMFVDYGCTYIGWKRGMWYHLASDANVEELHAFARRLRLRKDWFQPSGSIPHYDITENKMLLAVQAGAVRVPNREFASRMWNRYVTTPHAEPPEGGSR